MTREVATAKSQRSTAEEDTRSQVLRAQAVAELAKRREEIEWAIEGPFEDYLRRMSRSGEWGGEPELLMLSHYLERPIEVYMVNPRLVRIQNYGEDLKSAPIRILFHGYGHYSALVRLKEEEDA
ncbi:unnamed protein product [Effrenium voratum]|nr:unnamed protein product [Effrenium voratum]